MDIIFKDETFRIVGACMEVHREIGCGCLEAVYSEALACEFTLIDIPFQREVRYPVVYKGRMLERYYSVDFVCFDAIIIELKACESLNHNHTAQLLNYLNLSRLQLGLLINFGTDKLEWKRIPNFR